MKSVLFEKALKDQRFAALPPDLQRKWRPVIDQLPEILAKYATEPARLDQIMTARRVAINHCIQTGLASKLGLVLAKTANNKGVAAQLQTLILVAEWRRQIELLENLVHQAGNLGLSHMQSAHHEALQSLHLSNWTTLSNGARLTIGELIMENPMVFLPQRREEPYVC